jgi:hypothetical protein
MAAGGQSCRERERAEGPLFNATRLISAPPEI